MSVPIQVDEHSVEANGVRLHYRMWGAPRDKRLLLLHGLGAHARVWDSFAADAQQTHQVVALDMRGHGQSDWSQDYSTASFVADVEALRRALQWETFALMGHSLGARIAYTYAAMYPAAVTRLVVVEAAPQDPPVGNAPQTPRRMPPSEFDSLDEAVQRRRMQEPRMPELLLRELVAHGMQQREDGRWVARHDSRGLMAAFGGALHMPAVQQWALLPNIACPTLLVLGAESAFERASAEAMQRVLREARIVVVPDSRHAVMLDNLSGFADVVLPFLNAEVA